MKTGRVFFAAVVVGGLLSSICLGYSGGSGTAGEPYKIADVNDLLELAGKTVDYNKCFILTADINMGGQVFTTAIIAADTNSSSGFQGTAFTGVFDGDGHTITNFTINGNSYLGLFGYIDTNGLVENLGLEDCSVSGSSSVGGLVGYNLKGSITNCYSTGAVNGSSYVGGLVGYNPASSSITNCYSTGAVSGSSYVGGLVGNSNKGSISNCYSTGAVSGSSEVGGLVGSNVFSSISNCYSMGAVSGSSYVGGLVGFNNGGNISGCYFLVTSGPDNGYGTPLTDEEMKQQASFIGWDFLGETANGTCNYWQMPEGGGYPVLSVLNGYTPPQLPGNGTEEDPYIVVDANDLGTIWYRPSVYYILANDIDLAGIQWSLAVAPAFNGVLDGNGLSINNLFINGGGFLGLFGMTNPGSRIKNLGLDDCIVSGTGPFVGGLVGYNYKGDINNCYSTGVVSGDSISQYDVGGLVGCNYGGIGNCYSTGTVSGPSRVGGLVGDNDGSISNCYSTGAVSGDSNVGGLVGNNYESSISNCYFLVTSGPDNGYGTPLTDAQMKQKNSFIGWDFVGETANGTEDIWRMCVDGVNYPLLWWQFNTADFTCPDGVDFVDFAILANAWLSDPTQANWNGRCDIAEPPDSVIDILDLEIFALHWLEGL